MTQVVSRGTIDSLRIFCGIRFVPRGTSVAIRFSHKTYRDKRITFGSSCTIFTGYSNDCPTLPYSYVERSSQEPALFHVERLQRVPRGTLDTAAMKAGLKGKLSCRRKSLSICRHADIVVFFVPTKRYRRSDCGTAIGSCHSHCADFRTSSRSRPPIQSKVRPADNRSRGRPIQKWAEFTYRPRANIIERRKLLGKFLVPADQHSGIRQVRVHERLRPKMCPS